MTSGYESFFGLTERPFSLTSDAKYFFRSRSHGRAAETLTFGLQAKERFCLVTGDLGVGKTTLCRTLVEQLSRRRPVAYISSPLMNPSEFLRLLLHDLRVASVEELLAGGSGPIVIVDEAHALPRALVELLVTLAAPAADGSATFRFAFVGQSAPGDPSRLGVPDLDELVTTRIRLLPLPREECAGYIRHRLAVAGGSDPIPFSARALDHVFALSGGIPRLVNLLCEKALQEAAAAGVGTIEPSTVDLAAASLQLLRARPRRFRWFSKRVS